VNHTSHICSFSAQKCARKLRFYKPCSSAAPKGVFDHKNRILRLKLGIPVYPVSRLSKANYRSLSYSMVAVRIAPLLWNRLRDRLHNSLVLRSTRHWEKTTLIHPKPLRYLTALIRSHDSVWKIFVCVWWKACNRLNDGTSCKQVISEFWSERR